jgi:uncharacterized protein (DUF433 family)
MSRVDYRNIDKTAGVCGGRAVVAGTHCGFPPLSLVGEGREVRGK